MVAALMQVARAESADGMSFAELAIAAGQDDATAQNNLGVSYYLGEGVKQDIELAHELFKKSSKQGIEEAHYNLGCLYRDGVGVKSSIKLAISYFELASKQGFVAAIYNLGCLYFDGIDVEQDLVLAVKYFKKSAALGMPEAQRNLGLAYYEGKGVEQNYDAALKHLKRAAYFDDPQALFSLGVMYYQSDGVEEDKKRGLEYYKRAAMAGSPEAQTNLGVHFKGDQNNFDVAAKYFRQAADQGHASAQVHLGGLYFIGRGVEKNYAKSVELLECAALQGYTLAKKFLPEAKIALDQQNLVDLKGKVKTQKVARPTALKGLNDKNKLIQEPDKRRSPRLSSEMPDKSKSSNAEVNRLDAKFQARVSPEISLRVEEFRKSTGMTKKEIAEQALTQFFDSYNLSQ